MTHIQLATDLSHIKSCAPALRELRTFLTEDQITDRVQQQMIDGYHLAYVEAAGLVSSVAGYRILRNLTYGKFLYVDDLVTRADQKRTGYAGQLIDWLCEHASDQGCSFLILDSGVQRFEAHRFYLAHRMDITAHHFARKL
ncbi:MAG: GNAT family N-acetyltransferase [Verrucomicrobia bacterium]|nr:GNAT family N-acetyltransferase [Verrucomicrobiota bacterium]MBV8277386.1 GNAT family N-acetyltransferase [Verrucomicrobiota bacterium]